LKPTLAVFALQALSLALVAIFISQAAQSTSQHTINLFHDF